MKPFWEITEAEAEAVPRRHHLVPGQPGLLPRRRLLVAASSRRGGMPVTMSRLNLVHGLGPVLQIAEGWTVDLPDEVHDTLDERTDPTWPTTWFAPRRDRRRAVPRRLHA